MASKSGQRFIKENRAPRVHIEYEVETYGSRQKVELPFVMGVMSDLSGKSAVEKKALDKRDFLEFDMDNFEQRMEAIAPRAVFQVENNLTGEGKIAVDLTFKGMEDFTPGAVAKQVPALNKLLEARQELSDLMAYMDGKDGAQDLLDKVLKDPDLMKSLAGTKPAPESSEG
jgi:type VI secretion system protein ImpB